MKTARKIMAMVLATMLLLQAAPVSLAFAAENTDLVNGATGEDDVQTIADGMGPVQHRPRCH